MFYKYRLLLFKRILIIHLLLRYSKGRYLLAAFKSTQHYLLHIPIAHLHLNCSKQRHKLEQWTLVVSRCDVWWYVLFGCPQLCDCCNEAIN